MELEMDNGQGKRQIRARGFLKINRLDFFEFSRYSGNMPIENPKHQIFINLYTDPANETFFNATKSAIGAGYSEKTARVQGSVLLTNPNIKSAVEKKMRKALEKTDMLTVDWLNKIKMLIEHDMRDVASWGPNGITLKESSGLSKKDAYPINEISETITKYGTSVHIKTVSKDRALDMLAKFLAIYNEHRTVHTPESSVTEMARKERLSRTAELIAKRGQQTDS